jgi:hypothetical protein
MNIYIMISVCRQTEVQQSALNNGIKLKVK